MARNDTGEDKEARKRRLNAERQRRYRQRMKEKLKNVQGRDEELEALRQRVRELEAEVATLRSGESAVSSAGVHSSQLLGQQEKAPEPEPEAKEPPADEKKSGDWYNEVGLFDDQDAKKKGLVSRLKKAFKR